MLKALGALAMASALLGGCTGGASAPVAETEGPVSDTVVLVQPDTPTVRCPASYLPHKVCVQPDAAGPPVRAQVRVPDDEHCTFTYNPDGSGTGACSDGHGGADTPVVVAQPPKGPPPGEPHPWELPQDPACGPWIEHSPGVRSQTCR